MSAEDRELRDLLEEAQSQLKQTREQLLDAQTALVKLKEENEFLRWSLDGGEKQSLDALLAQSRAECETLRRRLAEQTPPPAAPRIYRRERVFLISVPVANENVPFTAEFVAFHVDAEGRSRDLIRTTDLEAARKAALESARVANVQLEDFT